MHNRFFIEEKIETDGKISGKKIVLESITSHIKAFRKQTGSKILLYDGAGSVFSAVIIEISKRSAVLELSSVDRYTENGPKVNIFLPLITSHIMDQLIARICELEISAVIPVVTERSIILKNRKEIDSKMSKWDKISKGAMIIAGKNFSTKIKEPETLEYAFKAAENYGVKLIAVPKAELYLKKYLESFDFSKKDISMGIFIGPEGDFSASELELSKKYGLTQVKLTDYVMSTFTASIYSVSNLICYSH
jgi:16S rRNA (uracil1498-N3)-methyltransferase